MRNIKLLNQLHGTDSEHFSANHFRYIAETGNIEGLHRFRNLIEDDPKLFASDAAKHGR